VRVTSAGLQERQRADADARARTLDLDAPARMLFVNQPAALQPFFEEIGVPVSRPGAEPDDPAPPDFAALSAALERHGIHIVTAANAAR
jgi:hypothetical protein